MSYTALLILAILRDDFTRLDREAMRLHISSLQLPDGRYVLHAYPASHVRAGLRKKTCDSVTVHVQLHT